MRYLLILSLLLIASPVMAQEETSQELDEITVTATRVERKTAEVPASIAVIGEKKLNDTKMFNVKEALTGTPGVLIEATNQGYDSRLIIRGAGLKAPYGVREIMVLRDGIPVTDPDSFTRLDMIDTQLIERIEVVKGPNSTLWGANAAGGVINIISKDPMARSGGNVKVGAGNFGGRNLHFSLSDNVDEKMYYTLGGSHRSSENSWRRWNEFDTNQFTFKPSVALDDGSTWETNISYSEADLQLPGDLDEVMYQEYLRTGEAKQTDGPWQYSGRYSDSYFLSSKLTKPVGSMTFIPLVYVNYWEHHHPVTARINDAKTWVMGTDLQLNNKHTLLEREATFTTGVTVRYDNQATEYYQYADYTTIVTGRIVSVNSDEVGAHMETQTRDTILSGLYMQESLRPTDKTMVDIGARVDLIDFKINSDWTSTYSWATGAYVAGTGSSETNKSYTAFSPRIGVSQQLSETLHVFASASSGVQTPSESELTDNPELDLVKSQSYEIGFKGRGQRWSFDMSYYYSPVENEVVKVVDGFSTTYVNAGETTKQGVEFAGSVTIVKGLETGVSYTYTDYTFDEFSEPVGGIDIDRSGNQLPYVPRHQSSVFASYRHQSGFKLRLQGDSWGSYWMDNANTEIYEGYELITNAMVGYEKGKYDLSVTVENLFDKRYAVEVTKDVNGDKSYSPAAPRSFMARLNIKF